MNKDYIFNNTTADIYPLMREIIAAIERYSGGNLRASKVSSFKEVLVELLTNAVKHSGTESSSLVVNVNEYTVEITKSDTGNAFYLGGHPTWPLSSSLIGERIPVYECDFYSLFAVIRSEHILCFEAEEYPVEELSRASVLPLHFGLLILVKLSKTVTYQYDAEYGRNTFRVVVDLLADS